jgi:hypothetical protein
MADPAVAVFMAAWLWFFALLVVLMAAKRGKGETPEEKGKPPELPEPPALPPQQMEGQPLPDFPLPLEQLAPEPPVIAGGGSGVAPGRVQLLASAIAKAEGFFVPGSFPARNHNPGDLIDPSTGVKRRFATDADGWDALYHQLDLIIVGSSKYYDLEMSLGAMAETWTGGDNPGSWARAVAQVMGVPVSASIGEALG